MMGKAGFDAHRSNVKVQVFKFLNFHVAGHFLQTDGEKGAFHLLRQHVLQAMARAFVTQDAQLIARFVHRQKKWQPLNVVPMGVRQEQGQLDRLMIEFGHQFESQRTQPCAGIENNDLPIGSHLHARSIAAVMDRARTWRRNGTSHAPEFQPCDWWGRGGSFRLHLFVGVIVGGGRAN